MVNIGEISKPSVGVSPVKPRRSTNDSELTTPADNIGSTVKVSSQIYPKNKKSAKKDTKAKDKKIEESNDTDEIDTIEDQSHLAHAAADPVQGAEACADDIDSDDIDSDDTSYDETGHLSHHGKIDIKA